MTTNLITTAYLLPNVPAHGEWGWAMFRLAQRQSLHAAEIINLHQNVKSCLMQSQSRLQVLFHSKKFEYPAHEPQSQDINHER